MDTTATACWLLCLLAVLNGVFGAQSNSTDVASCPSGWTPQLGSCYRAHGSPHRPVNSSNAKAACQMSGGSLITGDDWTDESILRQLDQLAKVGVAKPGIRYWTGLMRPLQVSDHPIESSAADCAHKRCTCVAYWDKKLNSLPCSAAASYICCMRTDGAAVDRRPAAAALVVSTTTTARSWTVSAGSGLGGSGVEGSLGGGAGGVVFIIVCVIIYKCCKGGCSSSSGGLETVVKWRKYRITKNEWGQEISRVRVY